jgi:ribosomal protein S17E
MELTGNDEEIMEKYSNKVKEEFSIDSKMFLQLLKILNKNFKED